MLTQQQALERLNITTDLLPRTASNRPGTPLSPTHITIHNTGNADPGANARLHNRYIRGADARRRSVSWHYTCDDTSCYKHLPTSEQGWHAGSEGNRRSIGIEVCENRGIDQDAAFERAALLTAVLMFALGIPADNIRRHKDWTGKNCPHILNASGGFPAFKQQASRFLRALEEAPAHALPPDDEIGILPPPPLADVVDQLHPGFGGDECLGDGPMMCFGEPETGRADAAYIADLEHLVAKQAVEILRLQRTQSGMTDDSHEVD